MAATRRSAKSRHSVRRSKRLLRAASFPVVGIGASAGGLEAIEQLLRALPPDTGLAFLLVLHLDPRHKSRLSEILSRATSMPVIEAVDGVPLQPDHVYTIPPDRTLLLRGRRLRIEPRQGAPAHFAPVDELLRSLAREEKNRAIGVILSGAASDGAAGLREIKEAGGITFAQDSASARYGGMPHAAVAAGGVDLVLPPQEIAHRLGRLIHHPYVRLPPGLDATEPGLPEDEGPLLSQLIRTLWKTFGVDFKLYKQSTVLRRISRRLALRAVPDLAGYLRYVEQHPDELGELYRDMFIGVTGFFREPDTFAALHKLAFPRIVKKRPDDSPVRVWVPGCSTGEEVYSIAISYLEHVRRRRVPIPIQIFGTDINEEAIRKARQGRYAASVASDVGPARLRFFVKTEDGFQVSKAVRDLCVFARHDVLRDPPFSRLDLISCRNLLIYLGGGVQQRLVPVFHYGLRRGGYLLLGSAESIDGFPDLFDLVDRRARIYAKKPGVVPSRPDFGVSPLVATRPGGTDSPGRPAARSEADRHRGAADLMVLNQYAPAAVLVNEDEQILQFRGHTGPYIDPSPGSANLSLLNMVRGGLLVGLRSALETARKTGAPAVARGLCVEGDDGERLVDLSVLPVRAPDSESRTYLVLFEAAGKPGAALPTARGKGGGAALATPQIDPRSRITQLKQELSASKAYLQSVIEGQEAGSEELRATNEELLSTNEELQSTTEELETANEELQSANEELVTLNEELGHRNRELSQAHSDILNLLAGMRLSVVVLDREQRIRQLTPSAEDMLGLGPGDVGRSLTGLRLKIEIPSLERVLRESIARQRPFEMEVQDQDGRWYSLQVRPYLNAENGVEGTVVALGDIHSSKRVEESLRTALRRAPAVLFTQDRELRYTWVFNPLPPWVEEILGRTDSEVFQAGDARRLTAIKQRVLRRGAGVREVVRVGLDGQHQWFDMTVEPLTDGEGRTVGVTCAAWNVTAQTEALVEQRRLAIVEERHRVMSDLHDGLAQGLSAIVLQLEGAEQVLEQDKAEARRQLARARDLAREGLEETRRVLQALGPRFLEAGDLPGALKLLVEHLKAAADTPVHVSVRGRPSRLPADAEENLLRVAQEALSNALRHAKAKRVVAGIAYRSDSLRLWVEDDGHGFRPTAPRPQSCLGLTILEERARRIGAKLTIRSAPGKGTRVEATLGTRNRPRATR